MEKKCSKCLVIKPISEFSLDRTKADGYYPSCQQCRHIYYEKSDQRLKANERYRQDPEKAKATQLKYRLANPDKCKEYRDRHYKKDHEKCLQSSANTRQKYRDDAFNAYGGYICACCGETIPKFLTIDHINGRTKGERSGWLFYYDLKKQDYPFGYQVLCYNCNLGRARNKGICPHSSS